MQRLTRRHTTMKCYGLGLGLDTFRIVSLGENFCRLDPITLMNTYSRFVAIISQEATNIEIMQQLDQWSSQMRTISCPACGCHHRCIAPPVLVPFSSNVPFSQQLWTLLLLLVWLLLVKLGRVSVCIHHCCICWQA